MNYQMKAFQNNGLFLFMYLFSYLHFIAQDKFRPEGVFFRSGSLLTFQSPVDTLLCTNELNINMIYGLPTECIYVFCGRQRQR
jgi:hypothetical protein